MRSRVRTLIRLLVNRAFLQPASADDPPNVMFNGGMAAANFGRPSRVIDPANPDAAYSTSNLPLRGAKGWLYEGGIRVPLIIKWPGKGQAASVIDQPVTGTDYYPTTSLVPSPLQGERGLGKLFLNYA